MNNKFIVDAQNMRRDNKRIKIIKLLLLLLLLLVLAFYFVFGFIYNSNSFAITLDDNLYYDKDLIIYDDPYYKTYRSELIAESIPGFDNINGSWLPEDIHENGNGSHNGENFIAYTFYIENIGDTVSDYYSQIVVEDVIKNVDDAVRIRVYRNDEVTTYAKLASNGGAEPDTVPFESDGVVVSEHIEDLVPGSIVKYTLVIWLEGKDPQCTNNIIGGEFKMRMEFLSEFVEK